jgi:hypothetical protein
MPEPKRFLLFGYHIYHKKYFAGTPQNIIGRFANIREIAPFLLDVNLPYDFIFYGLDMDTGNWFEFYKVNQYEPVAIDPYEDLEEK